MASPLRCLIVEDEPRDAELLLAALRSAGLEPAGTCVDTEEAYLEELHRGTDVVLSDYVLPRFSGLRALELLKQGGWEVPLIVVSGAIGEETAVAMMRLGAADYLLKDRLGRIGPAVTHALDQSRLRQERTQAEAALRASEARFHGTLDSMLEGCQIIGHDWRCLYVNETAAQHGRRKKEEMLGRTLQEIYPGLEKTAMFPALERCRVERQGARLESEFTRTDGSKAWFELSLQPVPEGIFVLSLDITERTLAGRRIREQLDELLRWQQVMLNREDRVQALKVEVNELLARQNEAPRYASPIPL